MTVWRFSRHTYRQTERQQWTVQQTHRQHKAAVDCPTDTQTQDSSGLSSRHTDTDSSGLSSRHTDTDSSGLSSKHTDTRQLWTVQQTHRHKTAVDCPADTQTQTAVDCPADTQTHTRQQLSVQQTHRHTDTRQQWTGTAQHKSLQQAMLHAFSKRQHKVATYFVLLDVMNVLHLLSVSNYSSEIGLRY